MCVRSGQNLAHCSLEMQGSGILVRCLGPLPHKSGPGAQILCCFMCARTTIGLDADTALLTPAVSCSLLLCCYIFLRVFLAH